VCYGPWQREETLGHLFLRISFAKDCWLQIGVVVSTWLRQETAASYIKRLLSVPFAMKGIMLICWCIWKERYR
jgi:hypothetical protein